MVPEVLERRAGTTSGPATPRSSEGCLPSLPGGEPWADPPAEPTDSTVALWEGGQGLSHSLGQAQRFCPELGPMMITRAGGEDVQAGYHQISFIGPGNISLYLLSRDI